MSKLRVSVTVFASLVLASALLLTGCKEKDSDKIADAQECLDKYAREGGGDLAVCEAYVAGITTPAAHGIRCATGFIRDGFGSAQSFIDAFEEIETVNSNTVATFLKVVSFDAAGTGTQGQVNTNYSAAQSTYGSCASSYAKGATMISAFGYLTNVLFKYACDYSASGTACDMDENSLADAFLYAALNSGDPETDGLKVDLGVIVVNTDTISCTNGDTNEKLCEFMGLAITNAGGPDDKAQVGEEFLAVLANPPP